MMNYYNPVKIIKTENWFAELNIAIKKLLISKPILVTSPGNRKRLKLDSKFDSRYIFCKIGNNPNFEDCSNIIKYCHNKNFDGLIALGGGSVMDLAKIARAYLSLGIKDIHELIAYKKKYKKIIPSIFIPTTHGTASEVTMWGTIWNNYENKKYSISNRSLYPNISILDGKLTLSLPLDMSIISVLDALSHSFESIWNKNANPASTEYGIKAICAILSNVFDLKENPNNLETRNNLLNASSTAGFAFSNTATAAAHSISYPLTLHYDVPHGIASSMSLIPLLNINRNLIQSSLDNIMGICNLTFDELIKRIDSIPKGILPFKLKEWGITKSQLPQLIDESFSSNRIKNNIVDLRLQDVRSIIEYIY